MYASNNKYINLISKIASLFISSRNVFSFLQHSPSPKATVSISTPKELTPTMSMAVALAAVLAVFILRYMLAPSGRKKALNLPPGPRGWPVIGSLAALAGAPPPHRALAALAARHGALMHLRLGSYHTVVASSAETARLVLKTHDLAFADRPPTAAGEITSYGYRGIVHTPYGPYWRMAHKLCATELFSARRVNCSSASAHRR